MRYSLPKTPGPSILTTMERDTVSPTIAPPKRNKKRYESSLKLGSDSDMYKKIYGWHSYCIPSVKNIKNSIYN
jgi:hypothetical protein